VIQTVRGTDASPLNVLRHKISMRILILTAFLIGCTDNPSTSQSSDDEPYEIASDEITFFELGYQDGATYDFMELINSTGHSVMFRVESGKNYQIKVILNPNSSYEQIVHDQVVTSQFDRLSIGVYCSLAYNISDDEIRVDRNKEQVVLDVANQRFTKSVQKWAYKPEAVTSKAIPITESETPFLVMYHPNNMGADGFEMAVKHAMRNGHGEIVATIRRIESNKGEQASGGSRDNRQD